MQTIPRFYSGKWVECETPTEKLCEIYVPPNFNYPGYWQGQESGNVYTLNRAYGTKYQWYTLEIR